jgi:hypothetical protein
MKISFHPADARDLRTAGAGSGIPARHRRSERAQRRLPAAAPAQRPTEGRP